jgi:SulP family sulfate permease
VFATITQGSDRDRVPGALIVRADGALLYFNVDVVRDRFLDLLKTHDDRVTTAVFFLGTTPLIDLAGADLLIELRHALKARGIELRLAGAHGAVRDSLIQAGLDRSFVFAYPSVLAAVQDLHSA